jgi:hypothetical protein
MRAVVKDPLDVRLHHTVIPPDWALEGQPVDGLHCSHLRTIPIATAPKVLLVEGVP